MRSSRVYEPTYTVKNLYNDFIILQDVFLMWNIFLFKWNLVVFTVYSNLSKFPVCRPALNQNTKKARALTVQFLVL